MLYLTLILLKPIPYLEKLRILDALLIFSVEKKLLPIR